MGYQVCEKWLKDRRQRELSYEDKSHYQKIVAGYQESVDGDYSDSRCWILDIGFWMLVSCEASPWRRRLNIKPPVKLGAKYNG